jgi:hydrogenase expression/formation protein HypC
MCIAIPGKLIAMEGGRGTVDIRGNILPVELGIVKAIIGDYILVHAGCAISVISQSEAEELDELFRLVQTYGK